MGKILLIACLFPLGYAHWSIHKLIGNTFSGGKANKRLEFFSKAAFIIGTIIGLIGVSLI